MKPRLIRASFFIWLIVPAAMFGIYQLFGLPHVIFSYDFYGSHADWSSRTYIRCTFVGPFGEFATYPNDGKCGWVAFFKQREAAQ